MFFTGSFEPTDEVTFEVLLFTGFCEPTEEVEFEVDVLFCTCFCEPTVEVAFELEFEEARKDKFAETGVETVKLEFAKPAWDLPFFVLDPLFFQ